MITLIVEDDDFKASDIGKVLQDASTDCRLFKAASVTSASRLISSERFDLVVLDMSLPTFDLSGPGGGGSPRGQGGIEIIRLAKRMKVKSSFIVVTQYPDIEIGGRDIALSSAAKVLAELFKLDIIACIHYEFDSDSWRASLKLALSRACAKTGL